MTEDKVVIGRDYKMKDGRVMRVKSKHDGMAYGYIGREYGYFPYEDLVAELKDERAPVFFHPSEIAAAGGIDAVREEFPGNQVMEIKAIPKC